MKIIPYQSLASFDHGWLQTRHHFSFADYYDPSNIHYGAIRVINDDVVKAGHGFDRHPHKDMEIITYIINGELTHTDSMGNNRTVKRGDAQYMSAGTGITHAEYNYGQQDLRLLQIWILPNQQGLKPSYGDLTVDKKERTNKWLWLVSGSNGNGKIKIYQDTDIFVSELSKDTELKLPLESKEGIYLVNMEGQIMVNESQLNYGDALTCEQDITIKALEPSHILALRTTGL